MCVCICMCVCVCVCFCVFLCVDMCVDNCVCVYVFIQDPDPESYPKLCEKSDPDPDTDPKKNHSGSTTLLFLIKNCILLIPRPHLKDVQATEETFKPQKRLSWTSTLQVLHFLNLFTSTRIVFQSSVTLGLKKFRRMSSLPCLTRMSSGSAAVRVDRTPSPAISNHVSGIRPPLSWRILWTRHISD
jgi:hypothetical protein